MSNHTLSFAMQRADLSAYQIAQLELGNAIEFFLNPVPDAAVSSSTATGFFIPKNMRAVSAYATASVYYTAGGDPFHVNPIVYAQLNSPSLLRIMPPLIRPLASAPGVNQPGMQLLFDHPIVLTENEVLQAKVMVKLPEAGTLGEFMVTVIVFMADQFTPVPRDGQIFWVGGGGMTTTAVPMKWTTVPSPAGSGGVFPDGKYAVLAVEHWSATAVAARVFFPGGIFRPGVISVRENTARTNVAFYNYPFGIMGIFSSFAPPILEVLCEEADTEHNMTLAVVKLS